MKMLVGVKVPALAGWLACTLAASASASAAGAARAGFDAACPSRSGVQSAAQLAALRVPVLAAIDSLDNAKVTLPSPSLASDALSYLTVSPGFAEHLDKVCVLGFFELQRGGETLALPLQVESVAAVKVAATPDGDQPQTGARIYFHLPGSGKFDSQRGAHNAWQFWQREQSLHLKIAAYAYGDGVLGAPYFGRDLTMTVSSKRASTVGALLFAVFFYLLAGASIPPGRRRPGGPAPLRRGWRWRAQASRLLPWNITGANGQASLSQLQMLVFTLIVATLLFYQWLLTGLLQELSTDLLYLIGISTAGTAATQVAVAIRKNLDPEIYLYVQQLGWFAAPVAEPQSRSRAHGLLLTNGRFDIYKFQMLVFTCVIAAYVIASGANELGNVQISATLLTLMGMSQGAYVGGRAAADQLTPLQDQLRSMQALQQRHRTSHDPQAGQALRLEFRRAAEQAGAMFGAMFGRVLPSSMLDLPLDDAAAPA